MIELFFKLYKYNSLYNKTKKEYDVVYKIIYLHDYSFFIYDLNFF